LWYLTGWEEPDSVLVLRKIFSDIFLSFRAREKKELTQIDLCSLLKRTEKTSSTSKGYKMTMFVRPRDPYDESWNGPRSGTDGVCQVFGADDVRSPYRFPSPSTA